jgi:BlaI family transcriptional regulator, penicillinase repressor
MTDRYAGLTENDLEIMNVVWEHGEVTVRQVHDALLERHAIAYTSVITMLAVLEGKGLLEKAVGEGAYAYRAARPREEVIEEIVADFLARIFSGSAVSLVQHLVDNGSINLDQVEEIVRSRETAE